MEMIRNNRIGKFFIGLEIFHHTKCFNYCIVFLVLPTWITEYIDATSMQNLAFVQCQ
jgi:hypothetical protein